MGGENYVTEENQRPLIH